MYLRYVYEEFYLYASRRRKCCICIVFVLICVIAIYSGTIFLQMLRRESEDNLAKSDGIYIRRNSNGQIEEVEISQRDLSAIDITPLIHPGL